MANSKTKKTAPAKSNQKNSLVKNINAKKKAGTSKPKSKSTISDENYEEMENNWKDKK
ncbi:MAG: hypothetical protein ABIN01_18325 [Ferruginibacter sp.]